MPDDTPAPVRDWRALLIDRLAGLAVAVLAVVLYALGAPDEIWILVLLGGLALVGVSVPLRGARGFARVTALVPMAVTGLLALALLAVLSLVGCASVQQSGERLTFTLRDDPKRPAPACLYRVTVDGELVLEGAIAECPAVPVCEERP